MYIISLSLKRLPPVRKTWEFYYFIKTPMGQQFATNQYLGTKNLTKYHKYPDFSTTSQFADKLIYDKFNS